MNEPIKFAIEQFRLIAGAHPTARRLSYAECMDLAEKAFKQLEQSTETPTKDISWLKTEKGFKQYICAKARMPGRLWSNLWHQFTTEQKNDINKALAEFKDGFKFIA